MSLITQQQLEGVRAIAERQLTTPFELWRSTRVENDFGDAKVWSLVTTGYCWLRQMSNRNPTMVQDGLIEGALGVYRLHTVHTLVVLEGDRFKINGIDYEVHNLNDDDTIQVFRTCWVRRIQ